MSSERNSVFISYSHHDSGYLSRLQVHLRPMLRYGGIDIWDDTRISPGSNWRNEIKTAIERAKVAILLVSADFLASDFIVENELPLLLKKANEGGTVILMVIIGHCRFQQFDELSKFQAVNNPTRPLSVLPVAERERVWAQLAGNVEAALIGRDLDEGWAVTNERLVYEALEDYVKEGADGSFLIISSEDYYVQFSPLFISYSRADGDFVDKIGAALTKRGIRYWRDIHEMKAGRIEKQINRAIRQNPTVLMVLSENSVKSDWVEHEVRVARTLEKDTGKEVMCPIELDRNWRNGPWPQRIVEQIREYNVLDFSEWRDESKFDDMFRRLIDGLELFYEG